MYEVIEKEVLNSTITKVVVEAPAVVKEALAGQFIILHMHEDGEYTPLTIASYGREEDTVTIIFQIADKAMVLLNQPSIEDNILDFVGPLGKLFHVDRYEKAHVIGGGAGCAITYSTAKTLHGSGMEVIMITGFRNRDLVILEEKLKQVSIYACLVSNDGSTDAKGLIANVLESLISRGESSNEVIAIGPLVVTKFVYQLAKKYGIKTVVSIDPIMIDGTRICGGCHLSADGETKSVCVDGPDFDGHLMDSDEAMSRGAMYRDFEAHTRDAACSLMSREVR